MASLDPLLEAMNGLGYEGYQLGFTLVGGVGPTYLGAFTLSPPGSEVDATRTQFRTIQQFEAISDTFAEEVDVNRSYSFQRHFREIFLRTKIPRKFPSVSSNTKRTRFLEAGRQQRVCENRSPSPVFIEVSAFQLYQRCRRREGFYLVRGVG